MLNSCFDHRNGPRSWTIHLFITIFGVQKSRKNKDFLMIRMVWHSISGDFSVRMLIILSLLGVRPCVQIMKLSEYGQFYRFDHFGGPISGKYKFFWISDSLNWQRGYTTAKSSMFQSSLGVRPCLQFKKSWRYDQLLVITIFGVQKVENQDFLRFQMAWGSIWGYFSPITLIIQAFWGVRPCV